MARPDPTAKNQPNRLDSCSFAAVSPESWETSMATFNFINFAASAEGRT